MSRTSLFVLLVLVLAASASADVPQTMSYQGVLRDAYGDIVADGAYEFTFAIYDTSAGGTPLWQEVQVSDVADGLFNVILGKVDPLTLSFDGPYWLGITVDADPELVPRVELATAPYAHRAAVADVGADADWVIVGSDIYHEDGDVGIGTPSPDAKLHVDGTVVVGSGGSGHDVNFYGDVSGGRLFWDASKMALRTGIDSDGTHWDDADVGLYSFATASNATAHGNYSTAIGNYTVSSGVSAVAIGHTSTASDDCAIAMGYECEADADYAIAIGRGAVALGPSSIALGKWVRAGYGGGAIVIGNGSSPGTPLDSGGPNSFKVGFYSETDLYINGYDHRVGIGTHSPDCKLDVSDMVRVGGEDYPSYPTLGAGLELAYRPSDNTGLIQAYDRDAEEWGDLYLGSGNVGIATSTPTHIFEVAQGAGNAIADGWDVHSSREYKKDIASLTAEDYARMLETLRDLDVVQYRYRTDGADGKLHTGLVAEDAPRELVGADGTSMCLSDCVGFLLAATKALEAENAELRRDVRELRARIDR